MFNLFVVVFLKRLFPSTFFGICVFDLSWTAVGLSILTFKYSKPKPFCSFTKEIVWIKFSIIVLKIFLTLSWVFRICYVSTIVILLLFFKILTDVWRTLYGWKSFSWDHDTLMDLLNSIVSITAKVSEFVLKMWF